MGAFDLGALGWMALAAVLGLPRLLASLESAGRLPGVFQRWNRKRAHELVERERRDAAIAELVANSATILEQVTRNGGRSLHDAVDRIEKKLDAHLEEDRPLVAEHHELMRVVAGHLEGHS